MSLVIYTSLDAKSIQGQAQALTCMVYSYLTITTRQMVFAHYSAWRHLSSLFIFYGMVATRGSVIYTHSMVDNMKQIRKSCNVQHLFHCGMVDNTKTNKEVIYGSTVIYAVYYRGMNNNTTHSMEAL